MRRLLPRSHGLPRYFGGSASALFLSRPAQASLTLRPAGSLGRPRRPSSRGFGPPGYPTKPLVSYRINRQLSGWLLPPLVTHAFGAHKIQSESNRPRRGGRRSHALPARLEQASRSVTPPTQSRSIRMANKKRRGLLAERRAYRLAHKKTDLGQFASFNFVNRLIWVVGSSSACTHEPPASRFRPSEGKTPLLHRLTAYRCSVTP